MGLDIRVKGGNKSYHGGYGQLHLVRWQAYQSLGGTKDFADFMNIQRYGDDEKFLETSEKFKNLLCHSDSEGSYTMRGKVGGKHLLTGNLPGLKKELESLKPWMKRKETNEASKIPYKMLSDVVNEAFKLKQKIEFH